MKDLLKNNVVTELLGTEKFSVAVKASVRTRISGDNAFADNGSNTITQATQVTRVTQVTQVTQVAQTTRVTHVTR